MLVESELVERARKGDEAAFHHVVLAYRKRICGTVARLISRPEDVEDVAQKVFLRLFESLGQLRSPEVFEPWLYRLTVNAAYDYLRRRRRNPESAVADFSEPRMQAADLKEGERRLRETEDQARARELVTRLFEELSKHDRVLLTLKEIEGLSLKELESVFHVGENALKVRLFRARQRALKILTRLEGADRGRRGS